MKRVPSPPSPSAHCNCLIPPAHPANNFPEVSFRIQQRRRADLQPTGPSSVPGLPGDTAVPGRVATHTPGNTPRSLSPCNQGPLPGPVQAVAPSETCFRALLARCQVIKHHCASLAFHVEALKSFLELGLTAGHSSRAGNSTLCFHVGSVHKNTNMAGDESAAHRQGQAALSAAGAPLHGHQAPCPLLGNLERSVNTHSL